MLHVITYRLCLCPYFTVDFFQKHNVAVMTVRELFEFITDPSITSENIDDYLLKVRTHSLVTYIGSLEQYSQI